MPETYRPAQQEILTYRKGWMGVSAVPGSGKTFTLSALAAELIRSGCLKPDQEILVVTLVNSAVENFTRRVAGFLTNLTILPGMSYRVRTLHGLAHDIIRERPSLVGLANDFTIIDDHASQQILTQSINAWIQTHTPELHEIVNSDANGMDFKTICRRNLPAALQDTAVAFIRTAKDRQKLPEELKDMLTRSPVDLPLAEMCLQIYTDYQRALQYRNGLDFDDLIRNALLMLQTDALMLERLRYKWPYVLEDEAQDSSRLQEEILRLLAGENGNWVRVGDPNQAIFETFTTASPQYLRNFIQEDGVISRPLPASGRSSKKIIDLANRLIDWTMSSHPNPDVRQALAPPYIEPVAEDDASPNPPDSESKIQIVNRVYSSEEELTNVARSVQGWLQTHPEETVAVLAMQNKHMEAMAEILEKKGIPYIELLRSTSSSRLTASHLTTILRFLVDPTNATLCIRAFHTWHKVRTGSDQDSEFLAEVKPYLDKEKDLFNLFYPGELDVLETWEGNGLSVHALNQFYEFRLDIQHWLEATVYPIDQLLLIIGMSLFTEAVDLALTHKLASYLNQMSRLHPDWRLPEFSAELATFAGYQRKLTGFSREDEGFDPSKYKGKVVLATLHKAKGLEWDKVYLTSANNFDFPSGAAGDDFYSEKWFIRNQINLTAEVLAELYTLLDGQSSQRGEATRIDRNKLVGERLRLLFVGITRAKKEITITCNNGMREKAVPAVAVTALADYLARETLQTGEKVT